MCKTNVKANIYYAKICKHEHEKNMSRLWSKIVVKTNVEHIERKERSYSYLYSFEDIPQKNFWRGFYVCIKEGSFLRTFLTESWLWINWNLIQI